MNEGPTAGDIAYYEVRDLKKLIAQLVMKIDRLEAQVRELHGLPPEAPKEPEPVEVKPEAVDGGEVAAWLHSLPKAPKEDAE